MMSRDLINSTRHFPSWISLSIKNNNYLAIYAETDANQRSRRPEMPCMTVALNILCVSLSFVYMNVHKLEKLGITA